MKNAWQRWGWPVLKGLLALAILLAVGHRFYEDLSQLDPSRLDLHPGWLLLSAGLYVAGLSLSALYWYYLLRVFGDRPGLIAAARGYFLGHVGKYVPGKALALLLRAGAEVNAQDSVGWSALLTGCVIGHPESACGPSARRHYPGKLPAVRPECRRCPLTPPACSRSCAAAARP